MSDVRPILVGSYYALRRCKARPLAIMSHVVWTKMAVCKNRFLPRDAMLARYMLSSVCPSVRPSVRHKPVCFETTRQIELVLEWEFPLTSPKLCYKENLVPPKTRLRFILDFLYNLFLHCCPAIGEFWLTRCVARSVCCSRASCFKLLYIGPKVGGVAQW